MLSNAQEGGVPVSTPAYYEKDVHSGMENIGGNYGDMVAATAIIYKDSLYKKVPYRPFLNLRGLKDEDMLFYSEAEDIAKFTNDKTIKYLYLFPNKKD